MPNALVYETAHINRKADMLLGGIPFAKGELREGGWFTLSDEDGGGAHIVEGTPAAWWPDGSIKWLHICGNIDIDADSCRNLKLSTGGNPQAALKVTSQNGEVAITGGVIDVTIKADPANILKVIKDGVEQTTSPGLSSALTYVGPDGGNARRFDLTFGEGQAAVVAQSSNRVVVRLPGKYVDDAGEVVSELILFIEVLREQPEVRVQPVWIYLGHPNKDLIDSLTVTAHMPISTANSRYGFGMEQGAFWDVIQAVKDDERGGDGPAWPIARQLQIGSSFYRVDKRTFENGVSWLKCVEGSRAQGWAHLTDDRIGVTGAMRYFWQEYPHSLEVDCNDGRLAFGLIPPGASALDLRRYSPLVYGKPVYEYGQGEFNVELHGAGGIAKTHELMLRFECGEEKEIASRALNFLEPLRVMPSPEEMISSRAIGHLTLPQKNVADSIEDDIQKVTDFIIDERAYRGWYGLMDYGDVILAFYSDRDRWAFDDGGYAWLNTEALPDYGLWIGSLRCANPKWLAAAIAMTRHNRDVDCFHRTEIRGLGSRHGVNHYSDGDKEWRVSMPLTKRLHYYLTADPWTLENIFDTVAVYQSYERKAKLAPAMAAALAGIMVKAELTGDADDFTTLRNLAGVYAAAVGDDGQFCTNIEVNLATGVGKPSYDEPLKNLFFLANFGGQHTLVETAELLQHQELTDSLCRYAKFLTGEQVNPNRSLDALIFFAFAYRHTGNERFQKAIESSIKPPSGNTWLQLDETGGDSPVDTPVHLAIANTFRRNKVVCHPIGELTHTVPYALAALQRGI